MLELNARMQNLHQPTLKQEPRPQPALHHEPPDDSLLEVLKRVRHVLYRAELGVEAGTHGDGDLLAAFAEIEAAAGWARMDYTLRQQEDTALDPETAAAFGDIQGR